MKTFLQWLEWQPNQFVRATGPNPLQYDVGPEQKDEIGVKGPRIPKKKKSPPPLGDLDARQLL